MSDHQTPDQTMEPSVTSKKQAPSHPGLIKVVHSEQAFGSRAESLVSLPAGSVLTAIEGTSPATPKWSTVQVSDIGHVELNSDLRFLNHSCAPTLVLDVGQMQVRVGLDKDIKIGDPLTFFYPSTEWQMDQPFLCNCASTTCKGWISGAATLSKEQLKGYWLNKHIVEFLRKRDGD